MHLLHISPRVRTFCGCRMYRRWAALYWSCVVLSFSLLYWENELLASPWTLFLICISCTRNILDDDVVNRVML